MVDSGHGARYMRKVVYCGGGICGGELLSGLFDPDKANSATALWL